MLRIIKKKAVGCFLLFAMLFTMVSQSSITAKAVKVSDVDYTVNINGDYVFIGNEIAGSTEIGTEYYMTYTVQSAPVVTMEQQGVIGSVDITQRIPFENGGFIRFTTQKEHSLFMEGYTYFVKFTAAEGGFVYDITRAKGDTVEKVYLDEYWGWPKGGFGHFGLWISGPVQADLIKVRCYDASGKDLGVTITPGAGHIFEDVVLLKDTEVEHSYDIKVDDKYCVALSNLKIPTSNTVYMEYTVESADVWLSQEGVILSGKPLETYPYQWGSLRFNSYLDGTDKSMLLEPGASYIIRFDKLEDGFEVIVQKTKNGERTLFTFPDYLKINPDENAGYFSLWFGDWSDYRATFHLTDFKCYDSNKNNLGVQCNTGMTLKHVGEHEDYAKCEATYYCEENGNTFLLYEDKTMKYTEDGVATEGTYSIMSGVMTVNLDGTEKEYEYMYHKITDSEGNVYRRLRQYTVNFVTSTDLNIASQELSNETGYYLTPPEEPVVKGKDFEGWYTGEGKKFDFDKIVAASTTLYARYSGDDLGIGGDGSVSVIPIVVISAVFVAVAVVVVLVLKRGGKLGSNKKE